MKKALTAVVVLTGVLAFPAVALAEGNLVVSPVEFLVGYPLCKGPGVTAYRIVLDTKDLTARLGNLEAMETELCTIRTRRGAQVTEIRIPCPATEESNAVPVPKADPVVNVAMSGTIEGCFSVTQHDVVSFDWQLTGVAADGSFSASGDLANPAISVHFSSSDISQENAVEGDAITNPSTWAVVVNRLPVRDPQSNGSLGVTTYVGISETGLVSGFCSKQPNEPWTCRKRPAVSTDLLKIVRDRDLGAVANYVEDGTW